MKLSFLNRPYNSALICLSGLLIFCNLGIFFHTNTIPIHWLQNEILSHRFFWSMDDIDQFTLHSGFEKSDFVKPLIPEYTDGTFRTRQVSYFFEMISFKFWQYLERGFSRDYTLIGLHVLNVVLLGILVFYLTQIKQAAWFTALLMLNSGTSLATLLFPFRNAKLLVITFFLIDWIILASTQGRFSEASSLRKLFFFFFLILAFFTDEMALFIFPLLFVYILTRDGKDGLLNRRLGIPLGISVVLIIGLAAGFLFAATHLTVNPEIDAHLQYFQDFALYLTQPVAVARDLGLSFFGYFLRCNLGYWDLTVWGTIAAICSVILLVLILSRRPARLLGHLAVGIIATMILKSFLLVHNSGVHAVFMPEGTVFPSLLFFSYYYVYVDTALLSLLIGIVLAPQLSQRGRYVLSLGLITLISISNLVHLKEGPADALQFHGWYQEGWQDGVKSILLVRQLLSEDQQKPVYLSFPSGNDALMKARIGDGPANMIGKTIPIMYLRSLEQGKAVISLGNIPQSVPFDPHQELNITGLFVDVGTSPLTTYDLELMKKEKGAGRFIPNEISRDITPHEFPLTLDRGTRSIVFFVKGHAQYWLQMNESVLSRGEQYYGQSYQIIKLELGSNEILEPVTVYLRLEPSGESETIQLVGPFAFSHEMEEIETVFAF